MFNCLMCQALRSHFYFNSPKKKKEKNNCTLKTADDIAEC